MRTLRSPNLLLITSAASAAASEAGVFDLRICAARACGANRKLAGVTRNAFPRFSRGKQIWKPYRPLSASGP